MLDGAPQLLLLFWLLITTIKHLLTYNGCKSYSLCFKPNNIKFYAPCFYLNKFEVPKVDQCKYLGIMISIK